MATSTKTATRPPIAPLSAAGILLDLKAVEVTVAVAVAVEEITASETAEAGLADGAAMT